MSTLSLIEHGIHNETGDLRVHVCFGTRSIYIFFVEDVLKAIEKNNYIEMPARQNGYDGVTALGYLVPPHDISRCIRITMTDEDMAYAPDKNADTSEKGVAAAIVAKRYIPPHRRNEDATLEEDKKGTDYFAKGKKVQVKCDWMGGETDIGGTGNLFIQSSEINPLQKY